MSLDIGWRAEAARAAGRDGMVLVRDMAIKTK
jgi:hypothetical protein